VRHIARKTQSLTAKLGAGHPLILTTFVGNGECRRGDVKHQINNCRDLAGRVPKRFRIIAGAAGSVDAAKRYFGRSPSSWRTVAEPGNLRGEDVYGAKNFNSVAFKGILRLYAGPHEGRIRICPGEFYASAVLAALAIGLAMPTVATKNPDCRGDKAQRAQTLFRSRPVFRAPTALQARPGDTGSRVLCTYWPARARPRPAHAGRPEQRQRRVLGGQRVRPVENLLEPLTGR